MWEHWGLPEKYFQLEYNEIQVWSINFNSSENFSSELVQILSDDEKIKLAQFQFQEAKRRFLYGRVLLRQLLGMYLGITPETVQFYYGESGKPFLMPFLNQKKLCFNLSHSNDLILFAFAYNREIGIDLEFIRSNIKFAPLVERFFSEREKSVFMTLHTTEKLRAFFNGWTRKEAYLKARGNGLSFPLHLFDVSLYKEPFLLKVCGEPQEVHRWTMYDLKIAPNYIATLVVENLFQNERLPITIQKVDNAFNSF